MSLYSIWHNFELPGQKFYAFGQIFNVVTHFCATYFVAKLQFELQEH